MAVLKLKKPVMINGEETKEIQYDLDSISGRDIQQAVKELQQAGIVIGVLELDPNYHAALFAKAAGLSFADISVLCAKDYNNALQQVRDFFLQDSEE